MKKEIVGFTILCLGFFSCNISKQDKEDNYKQVVNLDLQLDCSPKVAEIKCVPLETNDESIFNDVSKLIYRNNRFYIFDREGKSVFIFDNNGTFIRKIHAVGGGPEEYIEPSDMDVDEKGNIYISDNPKQRILVFSDLPNEPVRIIPVGDFFLEFAVVDSNFIYLSDVVSDKKMDIKLAKYDCGNKKLEILEKSNIDDKGGLTRFAKNYFYRSNDKLFYYKRFTPSIYNLSGHEMVEKFKLESEWYPTEDKILQWKTEGMQAMIGDYKYIRDISACYEADNSFFIVSQTTPSLYTIISKNSNKIYNFNSFEDKRLRNCIHVLSSDYHSYVSICPPTSKTMQHIIAADNLTDSICLKRIENLVEDSNPILVLFRFDL